MFSDSKALAVAIDAFHFRYLDTLGLGILMEIYLKNR